MRTGRPPKDPWERILNKISKNEVSGCWEWTGFKNALGYGLFEIRGKLYRVHRFSLARKLSRELTKDEVTRHMCHNPACCNPEHLEVGTQRDNMDDMTRAGRRPRGEASGAHKLSNTHVSEIRAYQGMYTTQELATMYNVHIITISRIHNDKTRIND